MAVVVECNPVFISQLDLRSNYFIYGDCLKKTLAHAYMVNRFTSLCGVICNFVFHFFTERRAR